jgi:hypothetical protein
MKPCPECARTLPLKTIAPSIELDTSTGQYTCANNHELPATVLDNGGNNPESSIVGQAVAEPVEQIATPEFSALDAQPFDYTGPGPATVPEPVVVTTVPASPAQSFGKLLTDVDYDIPVAGGDHIVAVRVPEAYYDAIEEYARSQGKTPVEYMNERILFGMEQQWFV